MTNGVTQRIRCIIFIFVIGDRAKVRCDHGYADLTSSRFSSLWQDFVKRLPWHARLSDLTLGATPLVLCRPLWCIRFPLFPHLVLCCWILSDGRIIQSTWLFATLRETYSRHPIHSHTERWEGSAGWETVIGSASGEGTWWDLFTMSGKWAHWKDPENTRNVDYLSYKKFDWFEFDSAFIYEFGNNFCQAKRAKNFIVK